MSLIFKVGGYSDLHDWLWSLAAAAAVPVVSGRSLLHNGLLLRNEPPLLRRQTRRINCKDNCVSCGRQRTRGRLQQLSLWLSGSKGERVALPPFLFNILHVLFLRNTGYRNREIWFVELEKYMLQF